MCGIVGISATEPVNQALYDALTVLQHRGQDAAGIVTCDIDGKLNLRKDNGLVKDVFRTRHMIDLQGNIGIGHARYPTAGCSSSAEAQPLYVNSPFGIALAHNGNLTNDMELKRELFVEDRRHINTDSDSEILLNIFAHELQILKKLKITERDIFKAVAGVHKRCRGGYAAVAVVMGYGLVGFRDPNGIRPMVIGRRKNKRGVNYMIASESVALDVLGYKLIRDVEPGEAVFIDHAGVLHSQQCAENPRHSPCIFEFVYFARPDSIIDGISVYKSRLRMGKKLARKIKRLRPDHDVDVVIPIPDTSRTSALSLARELGVDYTEGFIKNRYIGRTFIMPGQEVREKSVRQKLNAVEQELKGRNVMLVDDSIVRGTTSQQIIQLAREAGAKKVYMASAAPPVCYPNVYGIDMPSVDEFIAHNRSIREIEQEIGADWLVYQDLDDLVRAVRKGHGHIKSFDASCFNGKYVTGDITAEYLDRLDERRNDGAKTRRAAPTTNVLEIHNQA
ncbi:MAG: amidophosphoribosyltransferase [gamma proteobacterium symbiont of Bathyaustriella thionipta]|nr:amidophosphoribosyltransferase [gamma proteobacterium symbiont of Bathyaustriella thionipta]